jgi:DNA-binding CsgD family transcriptional regulator
MTPNEVLGRTPGTAALPDRTRAANVPLGQRVLLSAEHREEILALAADASIVLDHDLVPDSDPLTDPRSAGRVLQRLWDAVLAAMLAPTPDLGTRQFRLAELLQRIRNTEASVAGTRVGEPDMFLRRVTAALAELRSATSTAELLERAPFVGGRLGFDRTLVSTVTNATWKLESMCVVREPRWADEILAIGKEYPPALDGRIVETDIVDRAVSGLVFDAQHNPRVDRPLAAVTRSQSYGVAPLIVNGGVFGLVHMDAYHQQRVVDETDRALLTLFAEGLGQCLARTLVLDGLAACRNGLDQLSGALANASSPGEAPPPGGPCVMSAAHVDKQHPLLTQREVDVVRLLAAGEANVGIARKLVISEATVKSHVTHILRKLGAANRAEAVSHWLRSQHA